MVCLGSPEDSRTFRMASSSAATTTRVPEKATRNTAKYPVSEVAVSKRLAMPNADGVSC